jgi:hypothetical protein
MSILDISPDATPQEFDSEWKRYRAYLKSQEGRLPEATREVVLADWYHDRSDPRCPHDGWVELAKILSHDKKPTTITITLLGAYHNGHITFEYEDVSEYSLRDTGPHRDGNRDWLQDEVRMAGKMVAHEILFGRGVRWLITCRAISYHWHPSDPTSK